jgi:hypothetical protein
LLAVGPVIRDHGIELGTWDELLDERLGHHKGSEIAD